MSEVIQHQKPIAVYNEFRSQLSELRQLNNSVIFDYESQQGNRDARSHVYKLRQTKAAVEKARKKEKAASLEYGRRVDSEAKEIASELDDMISVHAKPLDEIEQRERDRIQKHQDKLAYMRGLAEQTETDDGDVFTSSDYQKAVDYLDGVKIDDTWEEFVSEAAKVKDESLAIVRRRLAERQKYESEQAELERLRKEAEARAQQERDEQIRREATARAEREAEERAKKEREAAERRELELKLAAEKAEREKAEAQQRADRAAKETEERMRREAEEAKRREIAEAEKRERDRKHKASINNAAVEALVAGGLSNEQAKLAVTLIAKQSIPNIRIAY